MRIQDFCDMVKFEEIMSNWAKSTGLATVAVGADGKYISECYNFTEFCIDLTRGSTEGRKRCEQCDRDGNGVYPCHAGLVDSVFLLLLMMELFLEVLSADRFFLRTQTKKGSGQQHVNLELMKISTSRLCKK